MTPSPRPPQFEHHTRVPAITATFLRWAWMRAVLHRGYWLVASLYLVLDSGLSPFQPVLIGVAQRIVSLVFEVPTSVVADTISRKWSLVISHILLGISMVVTGLVTAFPALAACAGVVVSAATQSPGIADICQD
jgi:sugar phosphate permease